MNACRGLIFLLCLCVPTAANDESASPVVKVIELLDGMANKVKAEEASAAQVNDESTKFCQKRIADLNYAIREANTDKEELATRVEKAGISIDTAADAIETGLSTVETNQADLAAATEVRQKETTDFKAEEQELVGTMATLEKAINVLQKEATGKSESLLQVKQAPNVLKAVEAMVSASMISAQDGKGLAALLQKSESDEEDFGAPVGPAYEKKSGGVIDLIEDLYDKAKGELADLRKKESIAVQNFEMLAQSLDLAIKGANREIERAKDEQAQETKNKAEAEKELKQTTEGLAKDSSELQDLTMDCRRKAETYAVESKDRAEEIKAVETAKEALTSKSMAASNQKYGPSSFLQLGQKSSIHSSADLANVEVVHLIRDLAHKQNSQQLALLAQRIGAAIRADHSGAVFDKIIKMINDMVASMEKSLREDTDKKAYCDAERSKVSEKKDEKQKEVDKLAARMDGISAKSAQLKSEAQDIQTALTQLISDMKEMSSIRNTEQTAFNKNSADMSAGLEGVKIALKVLREYYEGTGKRGGATGIIGMLEVCESDFAKSLADMKTAEKTAADDYHKESEEMKAEKIRKEQDIKYKTEDAQRLDKDLADVKADADSVADEMAAIIEYSNGIEGECSETQESFAEKVAKRQAEIDGLKQALETLAAENGGAFVQAKFLRGGKAHLGF